METTLTIRDQSHHIMPLEEKVAYVEAILEMPWLYQPLLLHIDRFRGSFQSVHDTACGSGYLLSQIDQKLPGLELSGSDIDPYFIDYARSHYSHDFLLEDGREFTKMADLIISNLALHHFDDPLRFIEHMVAQAGKLVLISDQIRPATEDELSVRLDRRKAYVQQYNIPYYHDENEVTSILEAYSKDEIKELFNGLNLPVELVWYDDDYYERFVAVLLK